jgi:uncharacterized protein (DUF1501 family)
VRSVGASARARPEPHGTLVLLQLTGGNDGLSTLVPGGDDGYGRARTSTRLPTRELLELDARVGLHPNLKRLRERMERGGVALFEGVGYPHPNRSHFSSLDIWHAADPRGRAAGEGWIGRLVGRLEDPGPAAVVHVGANPLWALHSSTQSAVTLSGTRTLLEGASGPSADELGMGECRPGGSSTLDLVRRATRDASSVMARMQEAIERNQVPRDYSYSPFSQDLSTVAALIHADLGVRVCSLELDGFDTHADQRRRHDRLMAELDEGLDAFLSDLRRSEQGRDAVVLIYSEFGRRVEENGSNGTDHGAASVAMALGERVRGGLHGTPPSLEALDAGDLAFTTDFRSLYGTIIERVFGVQHEEVLGGRFPLQDWLG